MTVEIGKFVKLYNVEYIIMIIAGIFVLIRKPHCHDRNMGFQFDKYMYRHLTSV